ncbi:uncharacterized protein RAG0_12717 [Rhynchosporium agropyri]|uniref:Uncharacterized protein n=1 Tax=Rhynchosporium agropyri TaxID=914238 RepID=A0A1E1L9N1_9HELO|nr:uncharacterized protein RAG0_12717 [Rhynchosporium agropyri]
MISDGILIGRRPLRTRPEDRVNAYKHQALAPWLADTGMLTPLYFHRRAQKIRLFNMARWIATPAVTKHMLRRPKVVLEFTNEHLQTLLRVAAISDYGIPEKIHIISAELEKVAKELGELGDVPLEGFFVRVSNFSLKDADDGNQKPLFAIYSALLKILSTKRAVYSLLDLQYETDLVDHKIFFFLYYTALDKLGEWRCFIFRGDLVAMSQTRFYQNHHAIVKHDAIRELVRQARELWEEIKPSFEFESTILDVYADVREEVFHAKLIEMNPWGAHSGTGSLLFHWIDDEDILEPEARTGKTVLRLVEARSKVMGPVKYLPKSQINEIGHGSIIKDELKVLRSRGVERVLDPKETQRLMSLPVPGKDRSEVTVTRAEALKREIEDQ